MKKNAFTLIELLVVIVIVGILATISVAQFNNYQEKARRAKALSFATQLDRFLLAETAVGAQRNSLRLDFEEGTGTITKDLSGSSNDIDLAINGATVAWTNETPDDSPYAVQIDASAQLAGAEFQPESELTLSSYFKIDAYPTNGNGKGILQSSTVGTRINADGSIYLYVNGTLSDKAQSNSGIVQLNKWHHMAASYDGTNLRVFLDGELVASAVYANTSSLGGSIQIGNGGFAPYIDHTRIYPVAFDQDAL